MLARAVRAGNARPSVWRCCSAQPLQRCCFAAAAATGSFETSDISGVRIAARDAHGPTTRLAIVAKGGTRYQPLPGLTIGLEEFAFKTTERRSALRITRESELLGGQLRATHTREVLIVEASFLREDLPYYAELLAEVISMSKYFTHEFHEEIEHVIHLKQNAFSADVSALALDHAHATAFHTGLGAPLCPPWFAPIRQYLNEQYIANYAELVYTKPNIAIVADGASGESLSKWVEQFFKEVPSTSQIGQHLNIQASKYHGGEQRTNHTLGNSMVIAFPGLDLAGSKPELAVLASLLGGQSKIKWTPGFSLLSKATAKLGPISVSAKNLAYSDAGILVIQLTGHAASIRKAAEETTKALKSIADGSVNQEDIKRAVANAKFDSLDQVQFSGPSMLRAGSGLLSSDKPSDLIVLANKFDSVNATKLKNAAKELLEGKASVSAVGDLFVLPFAEEIGLRV